MWSVLLLACSSSPAQVATESGPGDSAASDTAAPVEQVPGVVEETPPHPVLRADVVHDFQLTLGPEAWDALLVDPYTYVEATFDGGEGPQSIGVRLKGWSSFRPLTDKPSLKLDFDRTVDGGRFHDLEGIDLAKEVHDLAAISEFIAYRIYTDAGLPAPRTGFAELTINGLDYGFYTLVERRDDVFIDNLWSDDSGSLYESSSESWPCDLDDPGCDCFELDEQGSSDSRQDLEALCATATDTPDDSWLAAMHDRLDWTRFTRSMALEMALGTYDHYAGYMGNFYLYHQPDEALWWFSPSSMNVQFGAVKGTSLPCGSDVKPVDAYDGGLLVRRCWDIEACEAELFDALGWVVGVLAESDIGAVIEDAEALVGPAVAADPKREFSEGQFHDQLACIRDWLAARPAELAAELPEPCLGSGGDLDITTRGTLDSNHSCDRTEPDAASYPVASWSGAQVTVAGTPAGLAVGDEVLVWIAQAPEAQAQTVGEHLTATVLSLDGEAVGVDLDLDGAFGALEDRVGVLQRVPYYGDVRIGPGAVLTVEAWDGATGGLLALRASGSVHVADGGHITVDGRGYAGGPTAEAFNHDGHQGESVSGPGGGGVSSSLGYNQDAGWWQANAGGGGANVGGGGGEHAGGATGGESWDDVATAPQPGAVYGTAELSRLTLGSGGGAVANIYDAPGPGGAGGGVLWLQAPAIQIDGADGLTARGQDATAWTSGTWSYGSGGGAGGSILLAADELVLAEHAVVATGGTGVDFTIRVGGDGGLGRVRIDCGTVNGEACDHAALETLVDPAPYVGPAR